MELSYAIFSIFICMQTDISLNKLTRKLTRHSECDIRLKIL